MFSECKLVMFLRLRSDDGVTAGGLRSGDVEARFMYSKSGIDMDDADVQCYLQTLAPFR